MDWIVVGGRGEGPWVVILVVFSFFLVVGMEMDGMRREKKLTLGGRGSQVVSNGVYVKRIENQLNESPSK